MAAMPCENDLIDIGHTTFQHYCWTNSSFILWESGVSAKGVSVPSKDAEQPELSPDLLTAWGDFEEEVLRSCEKRPRHKKVITPANPEFFCNVIAPLFCTAAQV